jgi:beta-mannosidase
LKPHCMGTLYWQLNDTWPVASWSGLDHGGSWKLMHYMARRFYAPILLTARKFEDQLIVSAVNDLPTDFETTVEVAMISLMDVKSIIYSKHIKLNTNAGQEVSRVKLSDIPKDHMLFLSWTDEHGNTQRNHASPVAYKHLNLPNPDLTFTAAVEDATLSIKVSAQHLSLYVTAECDVAGHFSDNAFDLLGGETRTIHFTPDSPSDIARAKETLVIRDLYSSSH